MDGEYRIGFDCNLSHTHAGTRAVWTYGDGSGPIAKEGSWSMIVDSVFMVGRVQRYPPQEDLPRKHHVVGSSCIFYWLGELPNNVACLKEFGVGMFKKQAIQFKDEDSEYRIFIAKVTRGLIAKYLPGCLLCEYDEKVASTDNDAILVRVMNRAIVQNWVGLDGAPGGESSDWYSLYTIFFPFRFGFRTPDYFRSTLNAFLTDYYTNPEINAPMSVALGGDSADCGLLHQAGVSGAKPRSLEANGRDYRQFGSEAETWEKIHVQGSLESLYPLLGKEATALYYQDIACG
ncbi:putative Pdz/dhr/glgf [Seiridium cardinale]|uniref:Pdz/dhr/glgf n=1 Tax=Seiridium cardinale TaxID=138064 RepID=A0ABR2XCL7_9PEZI